MKTKPVTNEDILNLIYAISKLVPQEIAFSPELIKEFNRIEKHLEKPISS